MGWISWRRITGHVSRLLLLALLVASMIRLLDSLSLILRYDCVTASFVLLGLGRASVAERRYEHSGKGNFEWCALAL